MYYNKALGQLDKAFQREIREKRKKAGALERHRLKVTAVALELKITEQEAEEQLAEEAEFRKAEREEKKKEKKGKAHKIRAITAAEKEKSQKDAREPIQDEFKAREELISMKEKKNQEMESLVAKLNTKIEKLTEQVLTIQEEHQEAQRKLAEATGRLAEAEKQRNERLTLQGGQRAMLSPVLGSGTAVTSRDPDSAGRRDIG